MEKANIANETSNEFKKFSLKNVEDFLSDNEMKNTRGGSDGDETSGTCCANFLFCSCGISRELAITTAQCKDPINGTNCAFHWCCDSCDTASWVTPECWG